MTHSLDFPIDVESEAPPELDTLIAACKPHATCEMDGFSDRESLYYPANLPLTSTLELANHPILDAIRTALFPRLASGQYLVAVRDLLELVPTGGHMCPQRRLPQEEGKVATIIVTLPVRYRGGALVIHDFEGNEEKYYGRGGKPGDLEWTAFLADCDHEVETVQRGVRLTISYNVFLRTFGPSPTPSQSLMLPSDRFLDLISPILNLSRGQRIAFYLQEQYGFSPADILAESLVPHVCSFAPSYKPREANLIVMQLKGGDALLYHSLRLYKLVPELRWAAGGYVWPVDSAVECGNLVRTPSQRHLQLRNSMSMAPNSRHRRQYSGSANGNGKPGFSLVEYRDSGSSESDDEDLENVAVNVRDRVEGSGAVLLEEAGIRVLVDELVGGAVTRERVPFVSAGALDKLVINVLLVVYVP